MVKKRQSPERPRPTNLPFAHPDGTGNHVEVIDVAELRRRVVSHSIYDHKRLEFHLLLLVVRGRGEHTVDFEQLSVRQGDLLHIGPGQVHAFDAASTFDGLMVIFVPEALAHPLPLELTRRAGSEVMRPHPKDFSVLVDLAHMLESLPRRGERIRPKEFLPHVLSALVGATEQMMSARTRGATAPSGAKDLVRSFELLLEDHLATQHGASWYASKLAVSTRTLARACDAIVGVKPKRHIDVRICLEAKRHLIFSDLNVEELSESLGFSEPTNFVKFFRRVVGQTPLEFRRTMLSDP